MKNKRLVIGTRVSIITLVINIILAILKFLAGIFGNSSAMIADSLHSLSDAASTIAVIIGLKIASRPPDNEHHYGHARAETVATKIVALLLIVTGGTVGVSAIKLLFAREIQQPSLIPLIAAVLSIVVKEIMYRYTYNVGKKINSNALLADAWHHRSDAFSSVTALVGIAGARLGLPILDPLAGLVVALMILWIGFKLYWESVDELVDAAPKQEIMDQVERLALSTPGVIKVNQIKGRKHGPHIYIDLKICVNPNITVQEGHAIAHEAGRRIRTNEDIVDVLVHVNPDQSEGSS